MIGEYSLTTTAAANGTATALFQMVPTGLVWHIGQVSIETVPPRSGAVVTIRKNGRYITSSPLGSGSTAQGPPNIRQVSHDNVTVDWSGMTFKDQCIATLIYSEYIIGVDEPNVSLL